MNGVEMIAKERQRQIGTEGWQPFQDDRYENGELARAAACYALPPRWRDEMPVKEGPFGEGWISCSISEAQFYIPEIFWPWSPQDWRPSSDRVKELVRAGSLIAAEIDRLLRKGPA
jgi:hypothetical protein